MAHHLRARPDREPSTRPELRTLVSSPLLCALLCALYRQGNMYLPHSRRELLEAALDLLLVRWDSHRGLSDVGLQMSKGEQLVLLQRLAVSMAREEELLVSKGVAQRRLQAAMRGLHSHDADPADVLQHVLERTGLLREHPADHKVRFVHRTFRDYLVAKEMVESGELSGLANHADEDSFVIGLMPAPDGLAAGDQDAAARVLRTLAKIGGEQAWGKIRLFVAMHDSSCHQRAAECLAGFRLLG